MADVNKIIKDLAGDFSGSNEEQMKGIQLLKGLATSDDPKANKFMKAVDKATTKISREMGEMKKEESVQETFVESTKKAKEYFEAKPTAHTSKDVLAEQTSLKERTNYINPKALDMLAEDIAFWIENVGAVKAGNSIGGVIKETLLEMYHGGEISNLKDVTRFVNGMKETL